MQIPGLDPKATAILEEPTFYKDLHTELMFLNIGPSHPATHGTLRAFVALDGETIAAAVTEIGYLHRGFEKISEDRTYNQVIPYTDRLNYCSAILNNIGFAKAVEKLLDIEITDRCKFLRVIVGELMRCIDHCICIGTNLVDIGALTNFWFLYNKREKVYTIRYRIADQVGYTPDHDEIYWNVTGNGWEFPIERVQTTVILPPQAQVISAAGYTGRDGSTEQSVAIRNEGDRVVTFTATRALEAREGMTIAVSFPKGLVVEPGVADRPLKRI